MKILCLGNNGYNTDHLVTKIANSHDTINHGLIIDDQFQPVSDGYYHTTVIDITPKGIIELSKHFDEIIMLDQSSDQWSHWKVFITTYKLMSELEKSGKNTKIENINNIKGFEFFRNFVNDNKSFCIYPFILKTEEHGSSVLCARSSRTPVKPIELIKDWRTDPDYNDIRSKMIKGEPLDHCTECYYYEKQGIESSRQFETMEWVGKLGLSGIDDVVDIDKPYYYEIRLSSKCNLMCRSCKPEHSHLIEREYKTYNIEYPEPQSFKYSNLDIVDIDSLCEKSRLYLTGGEPSIMVDVHQFMSRCIEKGKTDFDFTISSNAQSLTPKFLKLVNNFTNMNFSISVDGYGKVNDYQRWLSNFDTVMSNAKKLRDFGHNVTFLTVPGMYNVTNLHLLLEYFDREWPSPGLYLQINHMPLQDAYNHPRADLVVESMKRCQQTKAYYSDGRSCKSTVDSLLAHYSKDPTYDRALLKEFFDYNDKLDRARGVSLKDYVPELDDCRRFV